MGCSPLYVVVFPLKPESDSSDLSALWFIEMYCWKRRAQVRGFCLPQQDCPPHTPLALSHLFSLSLRFFLSFPSGLQPCRTGGDSSLLSPHSIGVCACINVCAYVGDAADDDQGDE